MKLHNRWTEPKNFNGLLSVRRGARGPPMNEEANCWRDLTEMDWRMAWHRLLHNLRQLFPGVVRKVDASTTACMQVQNCIESLDLWCTCKSLSCNWSSNKMLFWILYTVLLLHNGCILLLIKACSNSCHHENLFLTHFSMTTTHPAEWCCHCYLLLQIAIPFFVLATVGWLLVVIGFGLGADNGV